jgi:hypothetical protein
VVKPEKAVVNTCTEDAMPFDLKRISKGALELPPRVLIMGMDGIGKSTFAAGAPEPFFIDANKGSTRLDVERLMVDTWDETGEALDAVERGEVKCKTLVLDSITDLEAMSHEKLFHGSTVDKHDGGYGKGDTVVIVEWRQRLAQLERIWRKGIGIVFVGHVKTKTFSDPSSVSYERFELSARPQLGGLLRQWVEYVLFAREEVVIAAKKGEATRAVTTGTRWIYTRRCPAYDAKARGSLLFPEKLLLSWEEFTKAVKADSDRKDRISEMEREIAIMLVEIGDPALTSQVGEYLKNYPAMVNDAHNRVASRLDECRRQKERGTVQQQQETAQPAA